MKWEVPSDIVVGAFGETLLATATKNAALALLGFTGVILQWSGTIVSIPVGWHLCDGTNGTPNLRDKFVVGAGTTYAVGATGGDISNIPVITIDEHVLTEAEMPAHNHAMFANVTNDIEVTAGQTCAVRTSNSPGEEEYTITGGGATAATLGDTADAGTGTGHNHTASSAAVPTLPPYYALAYIQCIAV